MYMYICVCVCVCVCEYTPNYIHCIIDLTQRGWHTLRLLLLLLVSAVMFIMSVLNISVIHNLTFPRYQNIS